jgi:hypothetical protein
MAKQDRDEVTLAEAADALGISRAALYGRVRRSRRRGEDIPFRGRGPRGRLIADRQAFDAWAATRPAPAASRIAPAPKSTVTSEVAAIKLSSYSLGSSSGNAVGDPLAASAETVDAPAATEPVPTVGAPVVDDLPQSYMENRVTTLLHGPDRIAVYWDVHPETAKAHVGKRWGIVVRTAEGETLIEIEHGARNWYIDMWGVGLAHDVSFGPIEDGAVQPIAESRLQADPAPEHVQPSGDADSGIRWGSQEAAPETALVEIPTVAEPEAVDAHGTPEAPSVPSVAAANAVALLRASSAAEGTGSSGGMTSPGALGADA